MKKKSFLIVSDDGKPVRPVTVNFFTVAVPALFIIIGVAAFFIPSDLFRLKAVEVKQKEELGEINKQLGDRFLSTLRVLNQATEQIDRIKAKKEKLTELTGALSPKDAPDRREPAQAREAAGYSNVRPAAMYAHFCTMDSAISAFASLVKGGKNPFERIPVCKPVADAVISRRFGPDLDPFTGTRKSHNGVDFASAAGTPVVATATGYVSRTESSEIWGKRVVIDHGNGISTVYAHLGTVAVGRGRPVKRGAVIGTIGVSGLSSGPHVHYEVLKNGKAINPEELFFPASEKL